MTTRFPATVVLLLLVATGCTRSSSRTANNGARGNDNSSSASNSSASRTSADDNSRENAPNGQECDSNYSGCVPIASDVDSAGGPGNGPEYVKGPIKVIGKDIYGLDRDRNGIACE